MFYRPVSIEKLNIYISGFRESFISPQKTVSISPLGSKHKLLLVSTQEGMDPLSLILDDAEIADLTLCLDKLINDTKVNVDWKFASNRISLRKPFATKRSIYSQLVYFLLVSWRVIETKCRVWK